MRRIDHQRRITARLLLLVFVPMLLLASLHHHGVQTDVENTCVQCEHHQPHDGHMSSQSASLHDCVLCQFTTIPFVAADVFTVVIFNKVNTNHIAQRQSVVLLDVCGIPTLRAPPSV